MQDHLTRMRTLGYRYERDEYHLLRFDRYLQTRLDASAQPLHVLVGEWAVLAANPILIQRPIITTDDNTTVVARDPETLSRLLNP